MACSDTSNRPGASSKPQASSRRSGLRKISLSRRAQRLSVSTSFSQAAQSGLVLSSQLTQWQRLAQQESPLIPIYINMY